MGLQLLFRSRLFMVRFSNGFQQNDTLLNTVLMPDKAQVCVFPFMLRITAFPLLFQDYISVSNVKIHEG